MTFYHVIVTHGGEHLVNSLVDSIQDTEPGANILLVDNGSDEPVSCRTAQAIFYTGTNLSRAEAANLGVEEAAKLGATHVAVVSDDVQFQTPHIAKVVDLLNFVDFVGPRVINPSGTLQSSGHDLPLGNIYAVNKMDDPHKGRFVTSVVGSCIFSKVKSWRAAGGMDPGLRYFHEDVALGLNAWTNNMTVWYEPSIGVMHLGGATRGRDIQTKMATPLRRKCWEQEARSQVEFERRIKNHYWNIPLIRERVQGLNT